mgnify:CR=1 FL=1
MNEKMPDDRFVIMSDYITRKEEETFGYYIAIAFTCEDKNDVIFGKLFNYYESYSSFESEDEALIYATIITQFINTFLTEFNLDETDMQAFFKIMFIEKDMPDKITKKIQKMLDEDSDSIEELNSSVFPKKLN